MESCGRGAVAGGELDGRGRGRGSVRRQLRGRPSRAAGWARTAAWRVGVAWTGQGWHVGEDGAEAARRWWLGTVAASVGQEKERSREEITAASLNPVIFGGH
jgi:hypothetical protein